MQGEAGKGAGSKDSERPSKEAKEGGADRRRLRWGIVILAALVAVIAWVATQGDDDGDGEPETGSGGFAARIVDEAELTEIAAASGHPVYWAGSMPGKDIEASEGDDGSVTVRYLDQGVEPGDDPKGTLTIGSYPVPDAEQALEGFAEREGAIVRQADDGRDLISSVEAPSSVYFAGADGSVQVEVYAPLPQRAMSLAGSGDVQPVS